MSSFPKDLFDAAQKVRANAHAPYSKCKVGAAVRTKSGHVHIGCNVENSSFPCGSCAEAVAINSAVAAEGKIEIAEVLIVTDASPPWAPCGQCRQIIAEFGSNAGSDPQVHLVSTNGAGRTTSLSALLPGAFTPKDMK